jgi:hypothetical protein
MSISDLPNTITVTLTCKVGNPLTDTRVKVGPSLEFQFNTSDSLEIFKGNINQRLPEPSVYLRHPGNEVYVKPFRSTNQVNYTLLTTTEVLRSCMESAWRRGNRGDFKFEAFVYGQNPKIRARRGNPADRVRRATGGRIQEAMEHINQLIIENPALGSLGPLQREYWAINHARQPESTELRPPQNRAFEQLGEIDNMNRQQSQSHQSQTQEGQRYIWVWIRLHGVPVQIEISIDSFREALMLPTQAENVERLRSHQYNNDAFDENDIDHETSDEE